MKATIIVTAVIVAIVVAIILMIDRDGGPERPPATPETAKPAPEPKRDSPAVKKRELPKGGNADLLRAIVKAAAEAAPSKEAIDEKALDERIAALRKNYAERLARVRSRARGNRRVVRGDGEPGNAWDYYRKALARMEEMTIDEERLIDSISFADRIDETTEEKETRLKKAAEVVEKYKNVIDLIRKGTLQSIADKDLEYEKGFALEIPYTSASIMIARFVTEVGKILEERGAYGEALELYIDTVQFSHDVGRDGDLFSAFVGAFAEEILFETGGRIMNHSVGEEALRKFLAESAIVMENQPPYVDTMDAELVVAESTIIKNIDHPDRLSEIFKNNRIGLALLQRQDPLFLKKVLVEGMDGYANYIRKLQEEIRQPTLQDVRRIIDNMWNEEMKLKIDNQLLETILPAITGGYVEFFKSKARMRELHLAAAVKLYRQEYGTFPEHLDRLVATGIVPSVPVDPFTGDSFRYVRNEDGTTATIFSIGENLVDNKGMDRERGEEYDDVGVTIKIPEQK